MEYTLEDAFETLKDAQAERQKEIDDLMIQISNNDVNVLNNSSIPEEIRKKQHKLCQALLNEVLKEEPRDHPIPKTSDLNVQALSELKEEVLKAQKLLERMKARLSEINDDVSYLEDKKKGLEKMKEAYLDVAEMTANSTYSKEFAVTKRLFQDVKDHLYTVVDKLFPRNMEFKELLASLTSAYTKKGDELYLDVTPEVLEYVHFLVEADIVRYHRNDKNKIRLTDML